MLVEVEEYSSISSEFKVAGAKPFLVVGIPAFNEEYSIARVVLGAIKRADAVVVCDDGSTDLTGEIAENLGAYLVKHERNLGYGAALKSLFRRARELEADILVTLDADGQHEPNEIPCIVKPIIENESDIVVGSRFVDNRGNGEMPAYRRLGAKFITRLVNGREDRISDAQCGFRAYGRMALERLSFSETGMGASVELLMKARKIGLRVCEVPCSCKYANEIVSTSTHNPLRHGLSLVMSFLRLVVEERPLLALGVPGILFLSAGVVFGIWMLQIYALRQYIETNVALASLSFVIIGFFMLSTAITLYAISRLSKKLN